MTPPERGASPYFPEPEAEIHLEDFWRSILRNRWIILFVCAAAVGAAGLRAALQAPLYEGEATVRVHDRASQPRSLAEIAAAAGFGRLMGGPGLIETEMALLGSRQIAERIADSLALRVELLEPAQLPHSEVFASIVAPRTEEAARVYVLTLQDDGSYRLHTEDPAPGFREVTLRAGERTVLSGVSLALSPALFTTQPKRVRFVIRPFHAAVSDLQKRLEVERPDRAAQILAVRYRSHDRVLAAAVPNAVVDVFVRYRTSVSRAEANTTIAFLTEQIANYRRELERSEQRLQHFREREQIVSLPHEAAEQVRRVAMIQAQRDEIIAERAALQNLVALARGRHTSGTADSYRQLAAYPVFFRNPSIQEILSSIVRLENQRAELLVQRTSEHIDVQGTDQRIEELELQLFNTASSYLESLDTQLASLDQTLSAFGQQIHAVPLREIEFARLMREQTLLEEIYTLLQTRLKEAEIQVAAELGDVRVVDPALIPQQPISPRPRLNLLLGLMLGLSLGVGIAFIRGALDRTVRSRDHAVGAAKTALLATIPGFPAAAPPQGRNGREARYPFVIFNRIRSVSRPRLITRDEPLNGAAEAFRTLRTRLRLGMDDDAKSFVVTSPGRGDGKSTLAANLAVTFAQQGIAALLVDGDLRRGHLHEDFGLDPSPGLAELIRQDRTSWDVIRRVSAGSGGAELDVLTAGEYPANPAELIGSARFKAILSALAERYSLIIIDTPPLNVVSDGLVIAALADKTILVSRAGVTAKDALEDATRQLGHMGARLEGVVINDIAPAEAAYYGHLSAT
jgi:capsular exopolysaccharide synthesis family protein